MQVCYVLTQAGSMQDPATSPAALSYNIMHCTCLLCMMQRLFMLSMLCLAMLKRQWDLVLFQEQVIALWCRVPGIITGCLLRLCSGGMQKGVSECNRHSSRASVFFIVIAS